MRIAVVGVGNCSCALIQALDACRSGEWTHSPLVRGIDSVLAQDLEVVAAFDIDRRKVGLPLEKAIFADPNCTTSYFPVKPSGVVVSPGIVADGITGPLQEVIEPDARCSDVQKDDLVQELLRTKAECVLLYLPVGAQEAAEIYAEAALESGCALVNCTPAVLGNSESFRERFASAGLPLIGDDMKSHIGSTTVHQTLLDLLADRGLVVQNTYQLNVGGNNDFLNMRDRHRAGAKKVTKAASLSSRLPDIAELGVGPSDHIPHLRDHKVGYIRIAGTGYLGMPFSMELRLEVEDSPNSAAVAVDGLRLAKAELEGLQPDHVYAQERLFKAPGRV